MRGPGGMPSERCSIDKGQPCKGATQPKVARLQRQAMLLTSRRPNKYKPTIQPSAGGPRPLLYLLGIGLVSIYSSVYMFTLL